MSNLKVMHVLSSPSAGGAEIFVKDLLLNSANAGIDAAVLFISSSSEVNRSLTFEQSFLTQLTQNNIKYFILPYGSRRNIIRGIQAFRQSINDFKPNVIHAHLLAGIVYSWLVSRKTPIIYTHHSTVIKTSKVVFNILMRLCDNYIGISKECSVFINQYLPKNNPSNVIYNSVDELRIVKKTIGKDGANGSPVKIIAVGRISPEKNYSLLIRAISKIINTQTKLFTLQIAGEGNDNDIKDLQDLIHEKGLDDVVELLGNRSDISDLLAKSDVFVMTSAWEGLPIALLEAQLTGLAALVTDVGGCKEVLNITKGGLAVPLKDEDSFSAELASLIVNDKLRIKMSQNAQLNSKIFSIKECIKQHKSLYINSII